MKINFGVDPDLHVDSGLLSTFSSLQNMAFYDISYHLSNSYRPIFTKLGKITDADKAMNPQHFGNDPVDIRIRIRINPEIQIRIPDYFGFTFWPWRRFALSECSCFACDDDDHVVKLCDVT